MRRFVVLLAALCLIIALPAATFGSQAHSFGIRQATAFFVSGDLSECGTQDGLILTVGDGPQGPNQQGPGEYFMWYDVQYYHEENCEQTEYQQQQFDLSPDMYTINGLAAAWVETPEVDVAGRWFSFDLAWISEGSMWFDRDLDYGVNQTYDAHLTGTVFDSAGLIDKDDLQSATINWQRIVEP